MTAENRRRVVFLPPVSDQQSLADVTARAAWYFFPWQAHLAKIEIPMATQLAHRDLEPPAELDPAAAGRMREMESFFEYPVVPDKEAYAAAAVTDPTSVVLIWREEEAKGLLAAANIAALRKRQSYYIVDKVASRMEGSFYLWLGRHVFGATEAATAASREALERFKARITKDKVYIFGTGPSLSLMESHDFSDGCTIATNTMVKNYELMDRMKPIAIVSGDPIFHAGCSRYAGEFRQHLLHVMERHKPFLFVPLRDYEHYLSYVPPEHRARVVGMPFDGNAPYNVDMLDKFYVNPKPNVLTLALLPIAATFFKEIWISGCDGRPVSQNDYFWSHDSKSQLSHLMQNIQDVHPGFFKLDYDEYYFQHCDTVETAIAAAEQRGCKVSSVTPSFIPALHLRQQELPTQRKESDPRASLIFSINPDAVSAFGHYLSYDDLLSMEAKRRGVPFAVIGPLDAEPGILVDRPFFKPLLTDRSWAVGNKGYHPTKETVARFAQELERALILLRREHPGGLLRGYMYCGSLVHAQVARDLVRRHDWLHLTINLFYQSFTEPSEPGAIAHWAQLLDQMTRTPRLVPVVPTAELGRELHEVYGVRLPIMPHPSTSVDDKEFLTLAPRIAAEAPARAAEKRPVVLFPGGVLEAKGANVTPEIIAKPGDLGARVRWRVRLMKRQNLTKSLVAMFEELESRAELITEHLDREQFLQMVRGGDVVVLPYGLPAFRNRTSGLLLDAAYCGRPVVALKGTWLGNIVEQWKCGAVAEALTAEAFLTAIREVVDDLPARAAAAMRFSRYYQAEHNWRTLAEFVLNAPVEGLGQEVSADVLQRARQGAEVARRSRERLPRSAAIDRRLVVLGGGGTAKRLSQEELQRSPVLAINDGFRHLQKLGLTPKYYAALSQTIPTEHQTWLETQLARDDSGGLRLALVREPVAHFLRTRFGQEDPRILNFDGLRAMLPNLQGSAVLTPTHASIWALELGYRQLVMAGVDIDASKMSGTDIETHRTAWRQLMGAIARRSAALTSYCQNPFQEPDTVAA